MPDLSKKKFSTDEEAEIIQNFMDDFDLAFTAESRSKEIGIRKILGASVKAILVLLSYSFIRWAIVANLIAFPIAWFVMNKWLEGYAYRISIGPQVFIVAGIITLVIVALTLAIRGYRTATTNPVESLRYE